MFANGFKSFSGNDYSNCFVELGNKHFFLVEIDVASTLPRGVKLRSAGAIRIAPADLGTLAGYCTCFSHTIILRQSNMNG